MVTIKRIDLHLKPAFLRDEGAIRYYAFDADIILNLPGGEPIDFPNVPAIEFFRSLLTALRQSDQPGGIDWEVLGAAVEVHIQTEEDVIEWREPGMMVPVRTDRRQTWRAIRRGWDDVRYRILQAHPSLAQSPALDLPALGPYPG